MTKNQYELIFEIAKRADKEGFLSTDRVSLIVDLKFATEEFNLRLDEFLKADKFNFAHDIIGIQNNINRETGGMDNYFLPRYANTQLIK